MRASWQEAGHARDEFQAVAWLGGAVLEEGEPVDGPRGMALAAPRAAMLLHRAADTALAGYPAPLAMRPEFAASVDAYVAHARSFAPAEAYYLSNHRGHLMFVRPDERRFITAEMIRSTSFIGTAADLTQRIAALADAGFSQVVFSIPPGQEHAIEDWARIRRAFIDAKPRIGRCPDNLPTRPRRIGRAPLAFAAAGTRVIATDIDAAVGDRLGRYSHLEARRAARRRYRAGGARGRRGRHTVQLCRLRAPGNAARGHGRRMDAGVRSERAFDVPHHAGVRARHGGTTKRRDPEHGLGVEQPEGLAEPLHLQRHQGGSDRDDEVGGDRLHSPRCSL
jgi:hypothetical protein